MKPNSSITQREQLRGEEKKDMVPYHHDVAVIDCERHFIRIRISTRISIRSPSQPYDCRHRPLATRFRRDDTLGTPLAFIIYKATASTHTKVLYGITPP